VTQRGDRTRARLIEATLAVVAEVGYARASTRAIADAAGVSEGTIYRHFPDKASLFFAAALEPSAAVLQWVQGLPALAGTGTVEDNLVAAVARLAALQERVFPLELAIQGDPELAAQRRATRATGGPMPGGPPDAIGAYIAAEQRLGRVRADVDPGEVSIVILLGLFGLAMHASSEGSRVDESRIRMMLNLLVQGIAAPR
jgi:AcrR family transcriptional regulator